VEKVRGNAEVADRLGQDEKHWSLGPSLHPAAGIAFAVKKNALPKQGATIPDFQRVYRGPAQTWPIGH
jgi:hypothetical protein